MTMLAAIGIGILASLLALPAASGKPAAPEGLGPISPRLSRYIADIPDFG
jgi:hypothetical protein